MSTTAFWDTNLLIYWLEKPAPWVQPMKGLRKWHQDQGVNIITSSLSMAEILVHPVAQKRDERVREYSALFQQMGCLSFGPEEARIFAEIRAAYPSVKSPDCIQLACASAFGVKYFFTNDDALSTLKIDGIQKIMGFASWGKLF